MGSLYDTIAELCEERHITGYRLCKDIKISPGTLTDLKMGRKKSMSAETAQKVADYFGVTVGYLLGQPEKEFLKIESLQHFAEGPDEEPTDEAYQKIKKFILDANQDELDETLRYIEFIKSQRK